MEWKEQSSYHLLCVMDQQFLQAGYCRYASPPPTALPLQILRIALTWRMHLCWTIHFPVTVSLGGFQPNLHLLLETLAFIIGFRYFLWLRKNNPDPINDQHRLWIIAGATFGALLFSRLIGALENPFAFFNASHPWLYLYTHKTVLGGFLGGLWMVEITKKVIGVHRSSGDLFTYPMILGLCIGRIGCFTNGVYEDTHGDPTSWITGMDLGDGLLRHPLPLYEIGFLLLLWIALRTMENRAPLKEGYRFQLFMLAYLAYRFLAEFIKPGVNYLGPFGTIQLACCAGFIHYSKTIFKILTNPKSLFTDVLITR